MSRQPLSGAAVVVTRPREQADELIAQIESAGGAVLALPVLRIAPVDADTSMLSSADIVIYISRNAVRYCPVSALGDNARIAAIGPATAAELRQVGLRVDIESTRGFDTESLLAQPALQQADGLSIAIVRGVGGRELLAATLRDRGADVCYVEVYQRIPASPDPELLQPVQNNLTGGSENYVVVMSVDSLSAMLQIMPPNAGGQWHNAVLVTPSRRVIQTASERLPDTPVLLSGGPQPNDIVGSIINFRDQQAAP